MLSLYLVVIEARIPTIEELHSIISFDFPSMPYSSDDFKFANMIPMIKIPSTVILNQISSEGCNNILKAIVLLM